MTVSLKKRIFIFIYFILFYLPRIPLMPIENKKYPFPFNHTQFFIRLSFATIIKKAPSQTLDFAGIEL